MESTQNIKKRIKSVANVKKITKAMELVAATKMRKAQEIALASRPYAFLALDILASLSLLEGELSELLKQRQIKKVLFVLVSSDKGLAGSFNSSVFKKFEDHMKRDEEKYKNEEKLFLAVGEKASAYLLRRKLPVIKKFTQVGDHTTPEQVGQISGFIVDGYLKGEWDRVVVVSMHFRSALKQEAHIRRILPVDFDHIKNIIQELIPTSGKFADLIKKEDIKFLPEKEIKDYLIEPSASVVVDKLARHLLFMQLYHLVLEANAAEHSARRMAMKTAADNASDLGEELNLQYNKSRQAAITTQIIEITAGAESLS